MATLNPNKGKTLTTRIHFYSLYVDNAKAQKEYAELCEQLKADPDRRFFNVLADPKTDRNDRHGYSAEVVLELDHVFDNQWNSSEGRIFDWYEGIYPSRKAKHGHWLEITEEMRAVRRNTFVCGYCGQQYAREGAPEFCTECLGSEYLKQDEIYLLRLTPVADRRLGRVGPPLSDAERAEMLPRYREAQVYGQTKRDRERMERDRKRVAEDFERDLTRAQDAARNAVTERDGKLWLLDRGIKLDNVIFYNHTGRFEFGWHGGGVSREVESRLLEVLTEFPFAYDIKCADGRKMSAER